MGSIREGGEARVRPRWTLALGLGALQLASCGAGTAEAISGFQVLHTKVAPARIRFVLADPEANQVQVELFARVGGQDAPLAKVTDSDFPSNPATLTTTRDGIEYDLAWDFPAEAFLPDDAHFVEDVTVFPQLGGRAQALIDGGNTARIGLGNDPPFVLSIDRIDIDPEENQAAGATGVEFTVADSSDDVVSVKVEFDIQGDIPDAGWQLARPPLLNPGDPTPELGIRDVQVNRAGTALTFFWETDADTDLKDLERDVQVRFTATDGVATGFPFPSSTFRVDNNEEPIVQLFNDLVITNPDERRGIPIPFRVIDEEGDQVEVIFQWHRESGEFPELPTDNAALDAILADPVLRREKHICTAYPHFAHGRVLPVDETSVRLPELAASESWILARGIMGRELELLRPSQIPAAITPTWDSNPLVSPVAALPVGDGLTALVLDAPGGGGRLHEIGLAAGDTVREIATLGPGLPSAMAYEPFENSVLVATDRGGDWRVKRVELATGTVTELHVAGVRSEAGPIRGLAVLGTSAALVTIGSSLVMLDHADLLAPREVTLLTDLATPWGIVVDTLNTNQVYLAERDAVTSTGTGRVLSVELDSHERIQVVVKTQPMQELEEPSALALERDKARLLAVAGDPGGSRQLVGLNLGGREGNVPFAVGRSISGEIASVASGPDNLLLLAVPSLNELLVGGGLEQRHAIEEFEPQIQSGEPRRQLATLETPLAPLARPGQPWRITGGLERATPGGVDAIFVWDSRDVGGGQVFLRALVRDDEPGMAAIGTAPKTVRASLDMEPLVLGSFSITDFPVSVAAADLDCDGDHDLVSANQVGGNLTIFFQSSPGSFDPSPLALGGPSSTSAPNSVAAADLDGDGDQDLVSANQLGSNLTIFFQTSPGSFDQSSLALGSPSTTNGPFSVAADDLDRDGGLDLVSANFFRSNLKVFFQSSLGGFDPGPRLPTTNKPSFVVAADLDVDGDQDLVSANYNGNNLNAFFQSSPGSFDPSPLALGGRSTTFVPISVAAADLDADGDQDLVSANHDGDNLTVFWGGR